MKISVIIPVFNAAGTLPRSLGTLFQETEAEMEVCAVNDCSNDDSLSTLREFKESFEMSSPGRSVKIISHDRNMGVAAARNTGLGAATGDYIMFLDSDDELAPEALKTCSEIVDGAYRASSELVDKNQCPDIVGWNWALKSSNGTRTMVQPLCSTAEDGLKAMMSGTLRWNLWLFMVRREILEGFRFVAGDDMGEDMYCMIYALTKAKSIRQTDSVLYTYIQNEKSISRTMSEKNLTQSMANVDHARKALLESGFSRLLHPYFDMLILSVKLPLLISLDKNDYIRWSECHPEASEAILKNRYLPKRTILLQYFAAKRLWIAVMAYNILVYKLLNKFIICRK